MAGLRSFSSNSEEEVTLNDVVATTKKFKSLIDSHCREIQTDTVDQLRRAALNIEMTALSQVDANESCDYTLQRDLEDISFFRSGQARKLDVKLCFGGKQQDESMPQQLSELVLQRFNGAVKAEGKAIEANTVAINRILNNLIGNSLDEEHIDNSKPSKIVGVKAFLHQGKVHIVVYDNGKGLPEKIAQVLNNGDLEALKKIKAENKAELRKSGGGWGEGLPSVVEQIKNISDSEYEFLSSTQGDTWTACIFSFPYQKVKEQVRSPASPMHRRVSSASSPSSAGSMPLRRTLRATSSSCSSPDIRHQVALSRNRKAIHDIKTIAYPLSDDAFSPLNQLVASSNGDPSLKKIYEEAQKYFKYVYELAQKYYLKAAERQIETPVIRLAPAVVDDTDHKNEQLTFDNIKENAAKLRFLVVNDAKTKLRIRSINIQKVIENRSVTIDCVATYSEADSIFQKFTDDQGNPRYDVILLDQNLGDETELGTNLVREHLLKLDPSKKPIIISDTADSNDVVVTSMLGKGIDAIMDSQAVETLKNTLVETAKIWMPRVKDRLAPAQSQGVGH